MFIFNENQDSNLRLVANVIELLLIFLGFINLLLRKGRIVYNKYLIYSFIFIFFVLFSSTYALNPESVVVKFIILLKIYIINFFIIQFIYNGETRIDNILKYIIYSGLIASIYILLNSDIISTGFDNIGKQRIGEQVGHVNRVSLKLTLAALISYFYFLKERKIRYIFITAIAIFMTLLTGSRKIFILIILFLFIYILLKNRRYILKLLLILFLCCLGLVSLYLVIMNVEFLYNLLGYRIEELFFYLKTGEVIDNSIYERNFMVNLGLELIYNRPFMGYGMDNYKYYLAKSILNLEVYSHNNFIEVMVGTGIFGLVSYYMLYFYQIKELTINLKKNSNEYVYLFLPILISIVVVSYTQILYYDSFISLICAISSSYLLSFKRKNLTIKNSKEGI